ncbi:MAG: hypothetical protein MOB07_16360 [Acidobacteria bacterium]|nr:hypothetical protein [Acidobacteriota bacterium]
MSPKRGFGQRINAWLDEPAGQTFRDGKWRFWFPVLIGLSILNAALTAVVFGTGGNLQTYMGGVLLGVGALLAWLGVGALHYSDSHDSRLARGVSALDSVTLVFVIAHFCFLLWVYGHLLALQSADAEYKNSAEKFNAEARQVSTDNVKIAEAARAIAAEGTKAERLRNDTAYQTRKAAEAGARLPGQRSAPSGPAAPALSTAPIELERPTKPKMSSTEFLTEWDWWVRVANFGELALAAITLIYIRNRSAATNARSSGRYEVFPSEIDADVIQEDRTGRRLDRTRKSDSGRQSPKSGDSGARKEAIKILREHLKEIAFYHPGVWFKADLVRGGVTIRLFKKDHGHEIAIAMTTQSDKLLATVNRPDFRERLVAELLHQGFPLNRH